MENKKLRNPWTSIVLVFLITFAVSSLIFRVVIASVRVVGDSMYPTLHDGDYGYVDLVGFKLTGISRFEIVVVDEPSLNELVVKRIVGLPGETVASYGGLLYINGEVIDQPFISLNQRLATQVNEVTLASDEYFVLGDNRSNSTDSRSFGPVDIDDIFARGFMKLGECTTSTCNLIIYQWPEWIS